MKKIISLVLLGMITVAAVGCSISNSSADKESKSNSGEKGEESMAVQSALTQEEESFLTSAFVGEDTIKSGNLTDLQLYVLRQYRGAVSYLGEKYPGLEFTVTSCQYQTAYTDHSVFNFVEKSDLEAYRTETENAQYLNRLWVYGNDKEPVENIVDDYYGRLAAGTYETYIRNSLTGAVPGSVGVYALVKDLRGSGFTGDMTIEELRSAEPALSPEFYIFLVGENTFSDDAAFQEAADSVREKMCSELNLKGTYTVYAVNDSSAEQKIRTGRIQSSDYQYKDLFNNL